LELPEKELSIMVKILLNSMPHFLLTMKIYTIREFLNNRLPNLRLEPTPTKKSNFRFS
jgi:hypothetical protein